MAKQHAEKYMKASTTCAWDFCIRGLVRCLRPVSSLSCVPVFPYSCGMSPVDHWVLVFAPFFSSVPVYPCGSVPLVCLRPRVSVFLRFLCLCVPAPVRFVQYHVCLVPGHAVVEASF